MPLYRVRKTLQVNAPDEETALFLSEMSPATRWEQSIDQMDRVARVQVKTGHAAVTIPPGGYGLRMTDDPKPGRWQRPVLILAIGAVLALVLWLG